MRFVLILFVAPLLHSAAEQSFDSAFRAGLVALQQNELVQAESNLEAAAKLAPANARVQVALSDLYLKLNRRTDADRAAEKAEALSPDDVLVAHTLALYYSRTERPLKAAALESKYATSAPSDNGAWRRAAEWYFAAAEPLIRRQKFAGALAILGPATTKIPSDAQLQLALGVADYGLRRFDDAASHFLKTIDLAPEERQPYEFLGRMLDQASAKLPEILAKFSAWRGAHPDDELGFLLEAKALDAANSQPGKSRELLHKAIELAPDDAAAHAELGILDERTQHLTDAAAELERAAALNPSDPVTHYHLARVYDRLGSHDRAAAERQTHAKLIAAEDAIR